MRFISIPSGEFTTVYSEPDGKLVKSNIVSNTVSRESREKTFTINLRQKKEEIKQLLAPLLCLCLVEEINGRREKVICCIPPGEPAATGHHLFPTICYKRTKILILVGIFQKFKKCIPKSRQNIPTGQVLNIQGLKS